MEVNIASNNPVQHVSRIDLLLGQSTALDSSAPTTNAAISFAAIAKGIYDTGTQGFRQYLPERLASDLEVIETELEDDKRTIGVVTDVANATNTMLSLLGSSTFVVSYFTAHNTEDEWIGVARIGGLRYASYKHDGEELARLAAVSGVISKYLRSLVNCISASA
jgi:hypothetical protein